MNKSERKKEELVKRYIKELKGFIFDCEKRINHLEYEVKRFRETIENMSQIRNKLNKLRGIDY